MWAPVESAGATVPAPAGPALNAHAPAFAPAIFVPVAAIPLAPKAPNRVNPASQGTASAPGLLGSAWAPGAAAPQPLWQGNVGVTGNDHQSYRGGKRGRGSYRGRGGNGAGRGANRGRGDNAGRGGFAGRGGAHVAQSGHAARGGHYIHGVSASSGARGGGMGAGNVPRAN